MTEQADVTTPLVKRLKGLPGVVEVRRQHSGSVPVRRGYMYLGEKGWPDLLVCCEGGRVLFIETKALDGKLRPEQREVHARLAAAGYRVRIAQCVRDGIEHVLEFIRDGGAE